jgi:hypothetical protein
MARNDRAEATADRERIILRQSSANDAADVVFT